MSEEAGLWALFASSFLAATLLPGGSEAVLYAVLRADPGAPWIALAVATAGNTLGGLSSWLVGRLIPRGEPVKGIETVRKYGAPALLLSWVPLIGDPLCVAAGWLRLDPWRCLAFIATGKFARYWAIAALAG
ncbi:MAG: DedA family protein [Burkholderiales bacterium]|nr:DedA family protein [Burkholderiales bacterium]